MSQSFLTIESQLASNIANPNQIEQSLISSSLAIQQSTAVSATVKESLAQQATVLGSMLDSQREDSSLQISLLEQVNQSTMEVAEVMQETVMSRKKASSTLELAEPQIKAAVQLIEDSIEAGKLAEEERTPAEEDQKRVEANTALIKEIVQQAEANHNEREHNEREFQAALASRMNNESPANVPTIGLHKR